MLRWETKKKIITSGCLQTLKRERERGTLYSSAAISSSRLIKVFAAPKFRRIFDYITTTLRMCPSTRNFLQGPQGNVFEKETFENRRLPASVRYSSRFCDRNGNISRYNDGQYSFTKFRAILSESENFAVIIMSQSEPMHMKKANWQLAKFINNIT